MDPILYPGATWESLVDHSAPGTLEQRNTIVLHITEGYTAAGAIAWFKQSAAPNRVSAHFVIDRDGTVYQLLDLRDTAWHASQVNHESIGIEHAAVSGKLMATDAQYKASAALLVWLCAQLKIPCDRGHIRSHFEASPRDRHVLCCSGALDPDKLVDLAAPAPTLESEPPPTA